MLSYIKKIISYNLIGHNSYLFFYLYAVIYLICIIIPCQNNFSHNFSTTLILTLILLVNLVVLPLILYVPHTLWVVGRRMRLNKLLKIFSIPLIFTGVSLKWLLITLNFNLVSLYYFEDTTSQAYYQDSHVIYQLLLFIITVTGPLLIAHTINYLSATNLMIFFQFINLLILSIYILLNDIYKLDLIHYPLAVIMFLGFILSVLFEGFRVINDERDTDFT